MESALYSRSTLDNLINILSHNDLNQLRRQMVKKRLDWKNPSRVIYFAFLKDLVDTEWDLLGPYKDFGQLTKTKSSHFIEPLPQSTFNVSVPPPLPSVQKPWYQPGLKFPCPVKRHNHEIADCKDFLSMSPEHRWNDIEKYRFCFTCLSTCLKPRDICMGRPCTFQSSVSEILICQSCALISQSKNLNIDVPKKSSRRSQSSNQEDPQAVLQELRMHRHKQQTTGYLIYS